MWSEFGTVPKAIAVSSARSPSLFSCRDIPACPVVLVQSVLDFVEAWFPENNTIFFRLDALSNFQIFQQEVYNAN